MKHSLKTVYILAVCLSAVAVNVHGADKGTLNIVKPVNAKRAVAAAKNSAGKPACEDDGMVLQKYGRCCPEGTSNSLSPDVCTPAGVIGEQMLDTDGVSLYCPDTTIFIINNNKGKGFSCADKDSTPFYSAAVGYEGSRFCIAHGYGFLLKIKPWGTVGCIKIGESQGDGCIEAGTCSFSEK